MSLKASNHPSPTRINRGFQPMAPFLKTNKNGSKKPTPPVPKNSYNLIWPDYPGHPTSNETIERITEVTCRAQTEPPSAIPGEISAPVSTAQLDPIDPPFSPFSQTGNAGHRSSLSPALSQDHRDANHAISTSPVPESSCGPRFPHGISGWNAKDSASLATYRSSHLPSHRDLSRTDREPSSPRFARRVGSFPSPAIAANRAQAVVHPHRWPKVRRRHTCP